MGNTNSVPQGVFGPGICWVTRTDIASQTPYNIGFINEFSTDLSFDTKELYGQNQYALLSARGTAKSTGKMKAATVSGNALSTVLLGQAWTESTQYDATTVQEGVPGAGPYTVTPAVPSAGVWNSDLGLTYVTTGEPLTYVTAAPAAGQYQVAAGVYTFAAADEGKQINFSFSYSYAEASGQSIVIQNVPIGQTPTFQVDYKNTLYGATYYLRVFQAIGSKAAFANKITDYMMPEYDFSFFANPAQYIALLSLATQA